MQSQWRCHLDANTPHKLLKCVLVQLHKKSVEISPHDPKSAHFISVRKVKLQVVKCVWCVCVFSPARDKYQQASSVCSLFQMAAPTELIRAITSRMPKRTRICILVTRSTLERFNGALVEFWEENRSIISARNTQRQAVSYGYKSQLAAFFTPLYFTNLICHDTKTNVKLLLKVVFFYIFWQRNLSAIQTRVLKNKLNFPAWMRSQL